MTPLYSANDRHNGRRLPAFRPHAICPKCLHDDVRTRHVPSSCPDPACYRRQCTAEHLERRCERCRYGWAEAIAELAPAPTTDKDSPDA